MRRSWGHVMRLIILASGSALLGALLIASAILLWTGDFHPLIQVSSVLVAAVGVACLILAGLLADEVNHGAVA